MACEIISVFDKGVKGEGWRKLISRAGYVTVEVAASRHGLGDFLLSVGQGLGHVWEDQHFICLNIFFIEKNRNIFLQQYCVNLKVFNILVCVCVLSLWCTTSTRDVSTSSTPRDTRPDARTHPSVDFRLGWRQTPRADNWPASRQWSFGRSWIWSDSCHAIWSGAGALPNWRSRFKCWIWTSQNVANQPSSRQLTAPTKSWPVAGAGSPCQRRVQVVEVLTIVQIFGQFPARLRESVYVWRSKWKQEVYLLPSCTLYDFDWACHAFVSSPRPDCVVLQLTSHWWRVWCCLNISTVLSIA